MDIPQRPGDVLAQPTRARIFSELGALGRASGTEELAARLTLHPNGVRVHLERLRDAGLVVRERPREGVGRPRDMWSIAAGARPGGEPPSAYGDLGRWLADVVARGKTGPRALEAAGRTIGRELAPEADGGSAEERMYAVLVSLGFAPQREVGPSGGLTYRLGNCPYRDVARERQDVVCTLHRGVTRGLLDAIEPQTELAGFTPLDPDAAGCLIELRRGLVGDGPARGPSR